MTTTIKPTREDIEKHLADLQGFAPPRPVSYGEAIQVARHEAMCFRRWMNALDQPDLNLIWLFEQDAVPVSMVPPFQIGEQSGYTTDQVNGYVEVFINDSEPAVRQRFSLLHEWYHVIHFYDGGLLYSRLGGGDQELRRTQIELICNEFAGHALMPSHLVKRLWFRSQDIHLVAGLFNVSLEAMRTRLQKMGLIGERPAQPEGYFRRSGNLLQPHDLERALEPAGYSLAA